MNQLRCFVPCGSKNDLTDTYTTAEGAKIGVIMPERVLRGLFFLKRRPAMAREASDEMAEAWAGRMREATVAEDLSLDDLAEMKRFATLELVSRLERLLAGPLPVRDAEWKARVRVASAICEIVCCSNEAAACLVDALRSPSVAVRDAAAFAVGRAVRPDVKTSAMVALLAAAKQEIDACGPKGWPRHAYSWISVLALAEPETTLRRCWEELSRAPEEDRFWLVVAMAKQRHAEALAQLARHLERERSSRVGLRILVEVGPGVSAQQRRDVLRRALNDDSPWWRWQAVQELWRVPAPSASRLARRSLAREPDPILQELLRQAIEEVALPTVVERYQELYLR